MHGSLLSYVGHHVSSLSVRPYTVCDCCKQQCTVRVRTARVTSMSSLDVKRMCRVVKQGW